MTPLGKVWVVAGAPGAGKTFISRKLAAMLQPAPALLDKDTMYGDMDHVVLSEAGYDPAKREHDCYLNVINPAEYSGMFATAREIRSNGCAVVLVAPFTKQLHLDGYWNRLVEGLGGQQTQLVWIQSDASSLGVRIRERNHPRDQDKLDDFDAYAKRVFVHKVPIVPHLKIDNRLDGRSVDEQLLEMLNKS